MAEAVSESSDIQIYSDYRDIRIPSDFRDLLIEVAVAFILEQPPDFISFGAKYFKKKMEERKTLLQSEDSSLIMLEHYDSRRRIAVAGDDDVCLDDDENEKSCPTCNFKEPEERRKLEKIIKGIFVFHSVEPDCIDKLIDAMSYKEAFPGEYVIRQGDAGDFFYIIDHGQFIALQRETGGEKVLKKYENEGSFGELSLLYQVPRACSIKALTRGGLWALDRHTFRKIVLKDDFEKRKMFERFLVKVPLLKGLSHQERANLADALERRVFKCGDSIIKQGELADGMYFIEEGTVEVTVHDRHGGPEIVIKTIGPEGYFGELALLQHKRRAASVFASTDVKLAFLQGEAFERLLGPCKEIMSRNTDQYKNELESLSMKIKTS